jgi:hypothetical protein
MPGTLRNPRGRVNALFGWRRFPRAEPLRL